MRAVVILVLPLWLALGTALQAQETGISITLGAFTPAAAGDVDFKVTVINQSDRDFCAVNFPNARRDPTFDGFGTFELEWPRGELTPIVGEASGPSKDDPKLVIFRMRAATQVSFGSSVLIEDFFPAPIGAALKVRWVLKGFWCDELDARAAPNPPRLSHVNFETGTFRRWPEETSVVITSTWRRFIIPHEQ